MVASVVEEESDAVQPTRHRTLCSTIAICGIWKRAFMPYQLVYSSSPAKKMMQSNLYIILRNARLKNKRANVTGLLVLTDGSFLQVLEGEENIVKTIFEKIQLDTRHQDITILSEGNVENRAFPNWEMAYASPSARDMANWSGLDNATTIQAILSNMKSRPDLAPKLFEALMNNIATTNQEANDLQKYVR